MRKNSFLPGERSERQIGQIPKHHFKIDEASFSAPNGGGKRTAESTKSTAKQRNIHDRNTLQNASTWPAELRVTATISLTHLEHFQMQTFDLSRVKRESDKLVDWIRQAEERLAQQDADFHAALAEEPPVDLTPDELADRVAKFRLRAVKQAFMAQVDRADRLRFRASRRSDRRSLNLLVRDVFLRSKVAIRKVEDPELGELASRVSDEFRQLVDHATEFADAHGELLSVPEDSGRYRAAYVRADHAEMHVEQSLESLAAAVSDLESSLKT